MDLEARRKKRNFILFGVVVYLCCMAVVSNLLPSGDRLSDAYLARMIAATQARDTAAAYALFADGVTDTAALSDMLRRYAEIWPYGAYTIAYRGLTWVFAPEKSYGKWSRSLEANYILMTWHARIRKQASVQLRRLRGEQTDGALLSFQMAGEETAQ